MISVTVTNRKAVAVPLTDVTVGAVGIPVSFHFTEDWDGLSKIAVFKAGDVTPVEVAILNNTAVVPHEVLVDEYEVLWIGIYGSNAQGTTVIPTIWANAGAIQPGTELETIDPSEPTPSWVAQVQAAAEEALTIANEIKDDAESGAFDGEDGTDGVSPTVTVTDITGGHLVTITDANGNHSFSVMNGTDGQNGSDGQPGADGSDGRDGVDGQDGTDGISPTITIVNIDGGHRVTMIDVNGSHSFDVLNGQDGSTGPQGGTGPAGATGAAGRGIRAFYPNGTSTVGDVTYDSYLMEFTDDTTFTLNVRRGAKGDVGPAGNDGITPTVEVTEIEGGHNVAFDYGTGDSRNRDFDVMDGGTGANKAPIITDTASGAIASFPDGADGLPLKSLVASIEPVQSGTGDPSPDNVRPISGWDAVGIEAAGVNLLALDNASNPDRGNFTYTTETAEKVIATKASAAGLFFAQYKLSVKAGETYTFAFDGYSVGGVAQQTANIYLYSDRLWGTSVKGNWNVPTGGAQWTATYTGTVVVGVFTTVAANTAIELSGFQCARGTAKPAFKPYTGNAYTIQFGETVYGGTLDVTNGLLTVDRAMVDLGTLVWAYTGTLFMTLAIPGIKPPPDGNTVPNCICEAYKAEAYRRLSTTDPSFTIIYEGSPNTGRLWLKDSTFTDLNSFKSFISGKHLCYELATPITYQLTPQQMTTLLGTNNIWADAGQVDVEYRADTKLYLEKLTAPTEDDLIADHAITSGSFFMIGNTLYKATAAIANGATITPGTNATRLSLADALNLLS